MVVEGFVIGELKKNLFTGIWLGKWVGILEMENGINISQMCNITQSKSDVFIYISTDYFIFNRWENNVMLYFIQLFRFPIPRYPQLCYSI